MDPFESLVERQIREAQERGEFDNLPGAGKPLRGLDGREDPDWWVKQMMQREGLDMADALPPVMALRKEAAGFPHSLLDLRTEESVRAVLEDFNRRVKLDRLRPAVPADAGAHRGRRRADDAVEGAPRGTPGRQEGGSVFSRSVWRRNAGRRWRTRPCVLAHEAGVTAAGRLIPVVRAWLALHSQRCQTPAIESLIFRMGQVNGV